MTDAKGAYAGSLWMAGGKSKYYEHLRDWHRATGGNAAEINGITGASVGAGGTLKITLDLADALFDAGYKLHIDAAVEDMRDSPSEVVVPLTSAGAGTASIGPPLYPQLHLRPVIPVSERRCVVLRQLHKFPGLLAALLVSVLALSGAVLSVFPALERSGAVTAPAGTVSVADLAGRLADRYPGIEQIRRAPSGKVTVLYFENGFPASVVVDPASGQAVADYAPSGVERWVTNLHRSLFLDDAGRIAAGLGALAMLMLAVSGLQMTARRMGGWSRILGRARGSRRQRLHVDFGRMAVAGLMLSALTGMYMSLATFDVIPGGTAKAPGLPAEVNGGPTMPVDRIDAFRNIDLGDLRELTFPYPDDPTDAYGIKTATGDGYVDQATGRMLVWRDHGAARRVYETIYMLHTGQGLWWLGLILGVTALAVPVMSVTGVLVWASRRRARPRIKANISAQVGRYRHPCRQRGRQHLGFRAHPARCADRERPQGAYRRDGQLGTCLSARRPDADPRRDLWRWDGARFGQTLHGAA